jgi:hypothetical protein
MFIFVWLVVFLYHITIRQKDKSNIKTIFFQNIMTLKNLNKPKIIKIGFNYFRNRLKYTLIDIKRKLKILK